MKTLLTYIVGFLGTLNPAFASITLCAISTVAAFAWINQQWVAFLARMDTLVQTNFAGAISFDVFALCNTLMPMAEILSYLTVWMGVLVTCTLIRVIKSFIPAIAT